MIDSAELVRQYAGFENRIAKQNRESMTPNEWRL